jgi:heat-inducible transcriptional repressor
MAFDLSDRDRKILEAVIKDYIRTAEPVGSRTLSRMSDLNLSPATIRNVMADLEEQGLLTQPHISAGRIPTDMGLRYYVDAILEVRTISERELAAITKAFDKVDREVDHMIRRTSRVLSSVSRHMGIVVAPNFSRLSLKQLQFVRLSSEMVLAILVGQSGIVQNRIVKVDEDLSQDDLNRFNKYLNEILAGLTIGRIKARIVEEMRQEKNRFDRMLSRALDLSRKLFDENDVEENVFMDGQVNLLENPEFADIEAMKAIFKAFEDKSLLVKLLDQTLGASGVQIFIGSENELAEMEGCTLIASRYSRGSTPLGTLGVIGPTRLNYSKIIPVVDYTAKLVSEIMEKTL